MSPYSNRAVRFSLELKILVNYLKVPDFAPCVAVYQKMCRAQLRWSYCLFLYLAACQSSYFKIGFAQAIQSHVTPLNRRAGTKIA